MKPFEIFINRPRRNAIDLEFLDWFGAELERSNGAPLMLRGTQDAFCAGLDLRFLMKLEGAGLEQFLRKVDQTFKNLYEHPAPVVALVEGHAIAGGAVILACCDQRVCVARDDIRIGLTEVALGACFPPSTLRICRDRIPRRYHEEILLGAGLYAPREALQVGLVDRVETEAVEVAEAIMAQLAAHPQEVYAHTKRALRGGVAVISAEDERRFHEVELAHWSSNELRGRVGKVLGLSH